MLQPMLPLRPSVILLEPDKLHAARQSWVMVVVAVQTVVQLFSCAGNCDCYVDALRCPVI